MLFTFELILFWRREEATLSSEKNSYILYFTFMFLSKYTFNNLTLHYIFVKIQRTYNQINCVSQCYFDTYVEEKKLSFGNVLNLLSALGCDVCARLLMLLCV